jgi:hypothetical protein
VRWPPACEDVSLLTQRKFDMMGSKNCGTVILLIQKLPLHFLPHEPPSYQTHEDDFVAHDLNELGI